MKWLYTNEIIDHSIKHKIAQLEFGDYVTGSIAKVGIVNRFYGGKNWKKCLAHYVELDIFSDRNVNFLISHELYKFKITKNDFYQFLSVINNRSSCYDVFLYRKYSKDRYATTKCLFLDDDATIEVLKLDLDRCQALNDLRKEEECEKKRLLKQTNKNRQKEKKELALEIECLKLKYKDLWSDAIGKEAVKLEDELLDENAEDEIMPEEYKKKRNDIVEKRLKR